MANLSSASVSDGKWHHVKVKLDSKRIQLSQDYERHHVTKIHQVAMESKPVKILSVGGVKQPSKVSQGFLGCLQGMSLHHGVLISSFPVKFRWYSTTAGMHQVHYRYPPSQTRINAGVLVVRKVSGCELELLSNQHPPSSSGFSPD